MRAIDTNVLVHAHREEMVKHAQAAQLLYGLSEGNDPWAIPIFCISEFFRLATHPRVFNPPTPMDRAISFVKELLESPSVQLLLPTDRYWPILSRTLFESNVTGNRVFDAQIFALCLEHEVDTLITEDRDFRRFQGIQILPIE